MWVLFRQMRNQRDSLATATAVLVEAVRTAEGGLWEAPKGLTRKDLAAWLGEQAAQVRELKESIERQRGGLVRREGEQRKQDGRQEKAKQCGPVGIDKPSMRSGGGGARKDPGGTADRGKDKVHNKLKISAMKKNMNFFGGLVVTYNNRKMSMKEKK